MVRVGGCSGRQHEDREDRQRLTDPLHRALPRPSPNRTCISCISSLLKSSMGRPLERYSAHSRGGLPPVFPAALAPPNTEPNYVQGVGSKLSNTSADCSQRHTMVRTFRAQIAVRVRTATIAK